MQVLAFQMLSIAIYSVNVSLYSTTFCVQPICDILYIRHRGRDSNVSHMLTNCLHITNLVFQSDTNIHVYITFILLTHASKTAPLVSLRI